MTADQTLEIHFRIASEDDFIDFIDRVLPEETTAIPFGADLEKLTARAFLSESDLGYREVLIRAMTDTGREPREELVTFP